MTQLTLKDSDFIISDVNVNHLTPNFYTEASNFKANAQSRGLHQLEIDFTVTLINAADIKRFSAFMLKARGRLNPFVLDLQDSTDGKGHNNPLFTDVKPMLSHPVEIGNNTIQLTSFSGTIPAGSMFQFPNDTKVYVILDDVKSNQTVEIFPASRIKHEAQERLNFSPTPLVRLADDEFSTKYENASELKLKVREEL
ncbi:hypothetical protein Q9X96_003095 [Vibrio vulnificus]|nr:hypothetical protein [Vibrio vulnificus]